jgi:hypothetical protein
MRNHLATAVFIFLIGGSGVRAQNPGANAGAIAAQQAQQATQQAIQANQQAIQQMQQAQQQAQIAAQQQAAADDAPANFPLCCALAVKPTFSVKAGTYDRVLQVRITDKARDSEIYYTTDGWTPTAKSQRYEGPVTIDKTTKLRAIAVVPYAARSLVASAQYTILTPNAAKAGAWTPGEQKDRDERPPVISVDRLNATPTQGAEAKPADGNGPSVPAETVLEEGTEVHLAFSADVSSKTAEVGDKILFTLVEDIKTENAVIGPKGVTAEGVVTQVNKTGIGGAPGNVSFRLKTLNVNGTEVPLRGSAMLEGDAKPPNAAFLIPVVGELSVLRHGTDAEIKKGTPMTAYVAVDMVVAQGKVASPAN